VPQAVFYADDEITFPKFGLDRWNSGSVLLLPMSGSN
jgi:hypothetical protein